MIQGYRRYKLHSRRRTEFSLDDQGIWTQKSGAEYLLLGANKHVWESAAITAQCKVGLYDWTDDNLPPRYMMEDAARIHLSKDSATHNCTCGIYITKQQVPGKGVNSEFTVDAFVTGWGAFVEYDAGWRVEHARIESMTVNGVAGSIASEVEESLQRIYPNVVINTQYMSRCGCNREHDDKLYRTLAGDEVTLCRLNKEEIIQYISTIRLMGTNDYAERVLAPLQKEYDYRVDQEYKAKYGGARWVVNS